MASGTSVSLGRKLTKLVYNPYCSDSRRGSHNHSLLKSISMADVDEKEKAEKLAAAKKKVSPQLLELVVDEY